MKGESTGFVAWDYGQDFGDLLFRFDDLIDNTLRNNEGVDLMFMGMSGRRERMQQGLSLA